MFTADAAKKAANAVVRGLKGAHVFYSAYVHSNEEFSLAERVISDITTIGVWAGYAALAIKVHPACAAPLASNALDLGYRGAQRAIGLFLDALDSLVHAYTG